MALEIKMPQLGESVVEGTIGKWLVKPGDQIKKYQPIAEVITDKVTAELPAPAAGVIERLTVEENATVQVGTVVAVMAEAGAPITATVSAGDATAQPAGDGAVSGAPVAQPSGVMAAPQAPAPAATAGGGRYSPAVLKLAQEHQVDLAAVKGTGIGGRITRKDVEAWIAAVPAMAPAPQVAAVRPVPAPAPAPAPAPLAGDQTIPVDPIRRTIAAKMVQSKHEAPHAWTMVTADVTGLVKLREQMADEFKRRESISLSYMPFFIKAVVESLREFPMINSQWAGDQIIVKSEINISIAVATEDALAVPVIKNADRLSIAGLAHAVVDLAGKARAGKLTMEDISGGTFTVNNTGYFGSVMSQPIINHPQAAIITVEAIEKRPVVTSDDAIAIRSMVNLCMSLDHRVLDGLICGRFLAAVKRRIEAYGPGTSLC